MIAKSIQKIFELTVRRATLLGAWFCILTALSSTISAATLEDYHARVQNAQAIAQELLWQIGENEVNDNATELDGELIAELEADFPANETIEWNGGSVETSNGWLLEKLAALRNEPDAVKQALILTEIEERLQAIATEVEPSKAGEAQGGTKDANNKRLEDILRRAEFQKPDAKEEGFIQRWLRIFWEWLSGFKPAVPAPVEMSGFPQLGRLILAILVLIAIALIAFAIYKFIPVFGWEHKPKKRNEARIILGEKIAGDATATDIFADAERLARDGDLRGAIRKGYIAALCELSDRKIIGLAQHKTNRDYLRDLVRRQELFNNVQNLTSSFERHWYGLQTTEMEDWDSFRSAYSQTIRSAQ